MCTWVLASPQNVFLTVFAGIMVVPALVSLTVYPMPIDSWLRCGSSASQVAAGFALVVTIKARCNWLSYQGAFGLVLQTICSLLVLAIPITIRTGYFHPSMPVSAFDETELVALSTLALGCVIGILRNDWWGYLGEVLLIAAVVAMAIWPNSGPSHSAGGLGGASIFALTSISWIYAFLRDLLRTGKKRWREQCSGNRVAA